MRTFSTHQVRNVLSAVAVVMVVGVLYFANTTFLPAPTAEAGSSHNITGWAWSENIGWVSMNSLTDGSSINYGVNLDTLGKETGGTGNFTGNAWSENLGWISFDRSLTSNPPSAPFNGGSGPIAQIDWSTGKATGWMRALAYTGDWDGWIKLSDDAVAVWNGQGVRISGNKFSGYAYGGDIVGWIHFAPTVNNVPVGTEIATTPCEQTDPTIVWGSCNPTVTCDGVTYEEGNTYPNVSGVKVGACSAGGTTVIPCATATLVCPVTSGGGTGTVKTHWWQF